MHAFTGQALGDETRDGPGIALRLARRAARLKQVTTCITSSHSPLQRPNNVSTCHPSLRSAGWPASAWGPSTACRSPTRSSTLTTWGSCHPRGAAQPVGGWVNIWTSRVVTGTSQLPIDAYRALLERVQGSRVCAKARLCDKITLHRIAPTPPSRTHEQRRHIRIEFSCRRRGTWHIGQVPQLGRFFLGGSYDVATSAEDRYQADLEFGPPDVHLVGA